VTRKSAAVRSWTIGQAGCALRMAKGDAAVVEEVGVRRVHLPLVIVRQPLQFGLLVGVAKRSAPRMLGTRERCAGMTRCSLSLRVDFQNTICAGICGARPARGFRASRLHDLALVSSENVCRD
jgi:hypothetical protein